MHASGDADV